MRLLAVGLGDIAAKAYLPVLTALPDVELHLATRNEAVLASIGGAYRIDRLHTSVADAIDALRFDAAFVHAATAAHPALVEMLLKRGVPVFVDKPLADNFEEAVRLVALAERAGRLLMVGFNRRHAPAYVGLRNRQCDILLMHKHRHGQPDAPRRVVFDDFIHVVDTLLFLSPAPYPKVQIETVMRDGLLRSVTLMLANGERTAIGVMHRDSGLDEERLEVIGDGGRWSILNLSESIEQRGGAESRARRGDWTPVSRQRGFEAMCHHFLQAVRAGQPTAVAEILETHRLCEAIVAHAERDDPD